jgi:hypothetical protein
MPNENIPKVRIKKIYQSWKREKSKMQIDKCCEKARSSE